jgi:hypothetical protein
MAYQYSNAAREIASIKKISTRCLLMVLASAVDSKTGTGYHSVACLRHWSQLSKGTFYQAVEELEKEGILRRERRRKGNRTNVWTLDIKVMESKRVSWDSIKPKDDAPEPQDEPDSGLGLSDAVKKAFEDDEPQMTDEEQEEANLQEFCQYRNKEMKQKPGTDGYYSPHKIRKIAEDNRVPLSRVLDVISWATAQAESGHLGRYIPNIPRDCRHITILSFQKAWSKIADIYDRQGVEETLTVSKAFEIEAE